MEFSNKLTAIFFAIVAILVNLSSSRLAKETTSVWPFFLQYVQVSYLYLFWKQKLPQTHRRFVDSHFQIVCLVQQATVNYPLIG